MYVARVIFLREPPTVVLRAVIFSSVFYDSSTCFTTKQYFEVARNTMIFF